MAVHSACRTSSMLKFLALALVVAVASAIVVPKIEPGGLWRRDFLNDLGIMILIIVLVLILQCTARGGHKARDVDHDSHDNGHGNGAPKSEYSQEQEGAMHANNSDGVTAAQPPPEHVTHEHSLCSTPTSLDLGRYQECFAVPQSDAALVKTLGDAIKANGNLSQLGSIVSSADSFASMRENLMPYLGDYADIVTLDSPFVRCIASKAA